LNIPVFLSAILCAALLTPGVAPARQPSDAATNSAPGSATYAASNSRSGSASDAASDVAADAASGSASDATSGGPARPGDVESLKQQMLQIQDGLRQLRTEHQREVSALKAQVARLHETVADLQKTGACRPSPAAGAHAATAATQPPVAAQAPFPTTDDSVVAAPAPFPTTDDSVAAAQAPFPTTDDSVVAAPASSRATAAPPATSLPTTDSSASAAPATSIGSRLAQPITLAGGGKSFLNISFDGQFSAAASTEKHLDALEVGDHDPQQRGFNARNIELALDGAVDPYFEGFANIVFKLDNDAETSVELEEAFMQTTTLPWNLQAKGGQFFAPLGRVNAQHPHTWDFVDTPLVSGRLLGPDGLRGLGLQVSWLAPLPWYSQLSLAIQNGNGAAAFSFRNRGDGGTFYGRPTMDRSLEGVQDLVFVPRFENSFDLTPTQTLLVGTSGAFGPNDTGAGARTEIYAADVFYKWKSAHSEGGWPFVKWQTEALLRRFEAGRGEGDAFPADEAFDDWGAYSQVVWGFSKGWTAGLRGDYLHMEKSSFTDDPERQSRWRTSPNVTWFPTEFSKFRLQYNHDFVESDRFTGSSDADSVFLQFEFTLGAHGAHKF